MSYKLKNILYDKAEILASKIDKFGYNPMDEMPKIKLESGVWFGNLYALIKVEPFLEDDIFPVNYDFLEGEFPHLKEKPIMDIKFNSWFDKIAPKKVEGNEIKFTNIVLSLENDIGRVYKYKRKFRLLPIELDFLSYKLKDKIKFISRGNGKGKDIIGLKPEKGSIKDRAVIVVMPYNYSDNEIRKAMREIKKDIKKMEDK